LRLLENSLSKYEYVDNDLWFFLEVTGLCDSNEAQTGLANEGLRLILSERCVRFLVSHGFLKPVI